VSFLVGFYGIQIMHTIQCSEVWGGNTEINTEVCAGALSISLYSEGTDGDRGGDIYYVSVCGKEMMTRVAIADVSGHGKEVSDTSQWFYGAMESYMDSPEGNVILNELNNLVKNDNRDALTTAQIITFNKGDCHLHYSNAGHPPLLIKKSEVDGWEKLELEKPSHKANLILGVIENTIYDRESVVLESDDLLFLYTDGVIEARNQEGQIFGTNQLINLLNKNSHTSAKAIKTTVLDSLLEYSGGSFEHDDVTMMALKVN
jgi:sigma-B regulation protein RsbU (phosphoserine phosphatase)